MGPIEQTAQCAQLSAFYAPKMFGWLFKQISGLLYFNQVCKLKHYRLCVRSLLKCLKHLMCPSIRDLSLSSPDLEYTTLYTEKFINEIDVSIYIRL